MAGKEKPPKPMFRYDPNNDRLKKGVVTLLRPNIAELILALKCASAANETSGCQAWGIDSPFQKKIESLIGPRPYGDQAYNYIKTIAKEVKDEPAEPESPGTGHQQESVPFPGDEPWQT
jgi:hypothetical protein